MHGGEQKSFFQKLEAGLEDAERIVFKAFVLGTTVLGAGTILSHEIGRLESPATAIEQKAPSTRQQEPEGTWPTTHLPSLGSGTEPVPERIREEQENRGTELGRQRMEIQKMIEDLTAGLGELFRPDAQVVPSGRIGPHNPAAEWLRLEKISEPDSITGFLTEVRKNYTPTLVPPPATPKKP